MFLPTCCCSSFSGGLGLLFPNLNFFLLAFLSFFSMSKQNCDDNLTRLKKRKHISFIIWISETLWTFCPMKRNAGCLPELPNKHFICVPCSKLALFLSNRAGKYLHMPNLKSQYIEKAFFLLAFNVI